MCPHCLTRETGRLTCLACALDSQDDDDLDYRPRPLPPTPTDHPPGTAERIAVYEARAAAGYSLHHPQDRRLSDGLDGLPVPTAWLARRHPPTPPPGRPHRCRCLVATDDWWQGDEAA